MARTQYSPQVKAKLGTVKKLIEHNACPEAEESVDARGKVYKLFCNSSLAKKPHIFCQGGNVYGWVGEGLFLTG